jgi:hypothetical protein
MRDALKHPLRPEDLTEPPDASEKPSFEELKPYMV